MFESGFGNKIGKVGQGRSRGRIYAAIARRVPTERKAVRRSGRGVDAGFENNKGKARRGRSRGRSNAAIARRVPRDAKRYDEVEELLRQASERIVAKLDEDDTQVAVTLQSLGVCLRDAQR